MSCKASSEARVWEFPGLGAPLTDLQRTISSRFGVFRGLRSQLWDQGWAAGGLGR